MKRLLIALFLFPLFLNAQDLIIKKTGDTLDANIINVTSNDITYRLTIVKGNKKVYCKIILNSGKQCSNSTRSKSQICNYHTDFNEKIITLDELISYKKYGKWYFILPEPEPTIENTTDLIVTKKGDTLKVIIHSINANTIKYSFPFDKIDSTVPCKAKLSKDLRCFELTNNENGKCDMHHSIEYFSIGISYVDKIMKESIWVDMQKEEEESVLTLDRQGLSDTEYFNQQILKTSYRMEKASGQGLTSNLLLLTSIGVMVAGGLSGSNEVVIVGAGIYLTSIIVNISAWSNHGKAARELNKAQLKIEQE